MFNFSALFSYFQTKMIASKEYVVWKIVIC